MATIVDKTAWEAAGQRHGDGGLVPVNPFTGLQFHYGMLLGVDDLETAQAYPRGKIRLHNAWLHREGVVWGFAVAFGGRNELTVKPGLALDAAGHELHLDRQACLDLGKWYAEHKDDADYAGCFKDTGDGRVKFSVHVIAKFAACLTRPVPAVTESCADSETGTAYSRVFETVELLLRPGLSQRKDPGYHRLRILFQLEPDDPKHDDVKARREAIQAQPPQEQPAAYLDALREFAALDVTEAKPQDASAFPEDPTEIVLADIADIIIAPAASGGWAIAAPVPQPDVRVRPAHVATSAIQELLCGPLFNAQTPASEAASVIVDTKGLKERSIAAKAGATMVNAALKSAAAKTGPTIIDASLSLKEKSITVKANRPLANTTLSPSTFSVSAFGSGKWHLVNSEAHLSKTDPSTIQIEFKTAPEGNLIRLVIYGTGPAPLLGAGDFLPLGAPGAGGIDDGVDYVKMFTIKKRI